jgi:hypothetical protein
VKFDLLALRRISALLIVMCLLCIVPARAQDSANIVPQQVFLLRGDLLTGGDQLKFINLLTGAETTVTVRGERYTALRHAVMYYDRGANRVKLVTADGGIIDHPFMQPTEAARRIDWLVSSDGHRLAWTVTEGTSSLLTTTTTVANIDGTNAEKALIDGPRDGIRVMPVGFDPEGETLYMDYQPDTIGDLTPFRDYAGLFALDLASGEVTPLPGEPGCFCGAGVGAGWFLRLALNNGLTGFDLRAIDLTSDGVTTIPAVNLVGYTQAGDLLIAPDGTRAVYALAQVRNFGTVDQTIQTVFVVVDLMSMTQQALTQPLTTFVRPIAWTEDDSAILFSSPLQDGTWKVDLNGGALDQVADATYIGTVQ